MDNLFTVFCYVVPCAVVGVVLSSALKLAERLCLARWDVAGKEKELSEAMTEMMVYRGTTEHLNKELSRLRAENEKLRQIPNPKPRF